MNNKIKIIKIEVIFKKFENFFYWLMDSRYRFYRLGGLFLAVAVLGGGFFIWQMFFGSDQAKADWYLSSWTRRLKITINADQVTSDLTNFPLLVATSTIDLAT